MAEILIVEDEHVLRRTFAAFLQEQDYTVTTAANYDEAVAALDVQSFDVVISDIILGGRTGIDLLRTIQDTHERCEVIMITGDPSVDSAAEAVRLGAFDYLPKPVKERELLRVTQRACNHADLARERDRYAAQVEESQRDLAAIFNSVNEGIVTVDAAMYVSHVNPAACSILAIAEEEMLGSSLVQVFPEDLEPALEALRIAVCEGEPASPAQLTIANGNAPRKVVEFNAAPLQGRGGAVLVLRDMTRLSVLEETLDESFTYHGIVGRSAPMKQVFDLVEDLKDTDSTVLICGESGTGKEGIAAAIRTTSSRSKGPYIRVNCAALAEDVLESELFGHVKGAFTGALKNRIGRFEAADGGTILLDEIGDVSPKVQLRLLRVLQEREFERVGDSRPIKTDVRIIATTNQSLAEKIDAGAFRQDLYYRLNVVRIDVPPLRDRKEDVPLLVEHFRKHFNAVMHKHIEGVEPEALEILIEYPWEGNVRELENCMERAFVVCRDTEVRLRHLPTEIREGSKSHTSTRNAKHEDPLARKQIGKHEIEAVLEKTDWNIAKTAKNLGIARNTLYLKMKNFGIQRPPVS